MCSSASVLLYVRSSLASHRTWIIDFQVRARNALWQVINFQNSALDVYVVPFISQEVHKGKDGTIVFHCYEKCYPETTIDLFRSASEAFLKMRPLSKSLFDSLLSWPTYCSLKWLKWILAVYWHTQQMSHEQEKEKKGEQHLMFRKFPLLASSGEKKVFRHRISS